MPHDSENIRRSKETLPKPRPKGEIPHLFGRGLRDRILVCLALYGPMLAHKIAQAVGSSETPTRPAINDLLEIGVLVQVQPPPHRYGKYIGLNEHLPIYRALVKLLLAIEQRWPLVRIEEHPRHLEPMPHSRTLDPRVFDRLFCSPPRSRILLFVAAVGEASIAEISRCTLVGPLSAQYAADYWEKNGVLRSRRTGTRRIVSLDPQFELADELHALLEVLVRKHPQLAKLKGSPRESRTTGSARPLYPLPMTTRS